MKPDRLRKVTRRDVLSLAAATVATSGCGRNRASARAALVSIVRAVDYERDLTEIIRRILGEHRVAVRGKRVLLKPNLVEFSAGSVINTDPRLVAAALDAFRSLGAADVRIAEGPGHRRVTWDLAEDAGYFSAVSKFEELFTDLNLDDVSQVTLRQPNSKLRSVYLPQTVLGCDLLVSMPKMKTHHWVGATLSMKNLFGLVPGGVYGWPKNVLHWAGINECIADLYRTIPAHFAIVDGIYGMEGNGPIQGTAKHAGVLVAGADFVAVDQTCCRIMEIDPDKIGYLQLATRLAGAGAAKQIGESIESVRTPFELLPHFRTLRLRS
jgi:uncharacterized protein (DUF362 family)